MPVLIIFLTLYTSTSFCQGVSKKDEKSLSITRIGEIRRSLNRAVQNATRDLTKALAAPRSQDRMFALQKIIFKLEEDLKAENHADEIDDHDAESPENIAFAETAAPYNVALGPLFEMVHDTEAASNQDSAKAEDKFKTQCQGLSQELPKIWRLIAGDLGGTYKACCRDDVKASERLINLTCSPTKILCKPETKNCSDPTTR